MKQSAKRIVWNLLLVLGMAFPATAIADIPGLLNFQGLLVLADGTVIEGFGLGAIDAAELEPGQLSDRRGEGAPRSARVV